MTSHPIRSGILRKRKLSAGTAFQALALLGAGAVGGLLVAEPAAAQDVAAGQISGTVVDDAGSPVAGATVTVQSTDRGFSRTATTGSAGGFTFTGLSFGGYDIVVSAPGFGTTRVTSASAALGGSSYTVTLTPEATAGGAEIVVTGTRARSLDFSQAATGRTFDVQEIASDIPVPRTLESVALLAPQVIPGDTAFNGNGGVISLGGSSVAENIYYINGMNVTNFRTFVGGSTVPFEFYDQVQIKTGGYQAEFGRSTGGAVIAVSRSGSNELHGGMNVYYEPNGLREDSPDTYATLNSQGSREQVEGNVWLSGPIIKDRLFGFAFVNPRYYNSSSVAVSGVETDFSYDTPFYGGKVDFLPFDGHRLEFTYFNDSQTEQTDQDTGSRVVSQYEYKGGENFVGRYVGNFTDWMTVTAMYGKSDYERRLTGTDASVPYTVDVGATTEGVNRFIQGIGSLLDNGSDSREQYRADIDIFANFLGEHHFRFGVDHEILKADNTSAYSGGEINYFYRNRTGAPLFASSGNPIAPNEVYLRRIVYTSAGEFTNKNTAFYLQDNWDVTDRLNLSLGIRNDRFVNYGNGGDAKFVDIKNQWGPRLGANFDVFGDNRTRLSAFYGRYYLPVAANTNLRLAGQENYFQEYYHYTGTFENPTPVGPPVSTTVFSDTNFSDASTLVSQNLEPQYMDEFIIGAETRVGDHWRFGINATYRNLKNVLEDADLNQYATGQFCGDNPAACGGEADLSVGSGGYVLLNPGKDVIINVLPQGGFAGGELTIPAEYLDLPAAKRKYYAVEFSFDRDFDGKWLLSGSYTWSRLKGNYEGGVKSDNGQDDVGLTQDYDEPGWMDGAYGFLPNDRRHSFKLYGAYSLTDNFQVGANARFSSGRPYGCLGIYPFTDGRAKDPYEDGGADTWYCGDRGAGFAPHDADYSPSDSADSSVLVGRGGAFRGAWEKRIDLNLQYKVPLNTGGDMRIRVDVFNVFNFDSPVDYNEVGDEDTVIGQPTPTTVAVPLAENYGKPTVYQTPRYFRFGLSFDF
ncbi:TonB-dependent receptor [Erythrobacter sp. LQ02-29]|uniref:TonB-dependent receptor n=1 Tax=Erythrobacter sp. LQ02-29 TaxID=2920384 RepID=UPI001F4EAD54|nr:TonB-dependent receptor [Erythrobacter sp. LQ02-29]MCP9222473.1 TonB-dependent receptor [Erythrobacter sp. LQ02-29]